MTHESLERYIEMYNSKKWNIPMSSYRLGNNIVVAKIWSEYPSGRVGNEDSNRFFFIEESNECVGIVFEMGTYDLHWFIREKNRKQGILHKALVETILPYIFLDGRIEQRATGDSEENIAYLIRQGFKEREGDREIAYFLASDLVKSFDLSLIKRTPLTSDEFQIIKQQLYKLAGELRVIRDQIECAYGDDCSIESLAYDIHDLGLEIEFNCQSFESQ